MEKDYLPKEVMIDATRKTILKSLLFIFAFLFLANVLIYHYLKYNTPNLGYEIIIKKWKLVETMREKRDWLILGDSTCNQGISALALERKINASAINLCTIGDMLTVNDSWMLETYINKFGAPKNILIIHAYDVWQRDAVNLNLASQIPVSILIKEKPNPWIFNKKDEARLLLNKYIPLYSQRTSLITAMVNAFRRKDIVVQENFDEGGFMPVKYANSETISASLSGHKDFVKSNKFYMSSNNLAGLENIKKLAETYGFNVFIANSPINEELSNDENFKNYFSNISQYLTDFANKSNRVYYIKDIFPFSKDRMVSVDHITAEAAQEYSEKLAEEIINNSDNKR